MRWIVVSLLVVNIFAFVAQFALRGREEPSVPISPVEVGAGSQKGDMLTLLSELDTETVEQMKAAKKAAATALADNDDEALCTFVGPFEALLQAEYLVERLSALEVPAEIQELEIPGEIGYWVYLPPRDNRQQAFDELREIQPNGIDSYVIPRGELANGISFGMYSQGELAKSRLEDMLSQGYAAEIREIPRIHRETWVIAKPEAAQFVDPSMWESVLQGPEAVERRQNFCPPVASSQNFL